MSDLPGPAARPTSAESEPKSVASLGPQAAPIPPSPAPVAPRLEGFAPAPQNPPAPSRLSSLAGTHWLLVAVAFVAGLAIGYLVRGTGNPNPSGPATGEPTRVEVSADDDPALGPADAPVTLIEFSDYNCPYCRHWYQDTLPVILQEHGDHVRFVYRDLPVVGGGAVGFLAAQAAECADDQGAYWEFQEALFRAEFGLSRDAYLAYADGLGLDREALAECIDSGYHEDEVRADLADAYALGVGSTPTFFINGIPVIGARPTEVFLAIIESELEQ